MWINYNTKANSRLLILQVAMWDSPTLVLVFLAASDNAETAPLPSLFTGELTGHGDQR